MAGGVLEQHGYEAFHRAEGCAVNHYRTVLGVVGTGIFELEAFGQIVVYLNGAELPTAADGVFDHEVEFGSIESCLAKFCAGIDTLFSTSFDDSLLGFVPVFVAADIFFFVSRVAE